MSAIILDTETTGFTDPVAVEVAWATISSPRDLMFGHVAFNQRFDPGKPIELGAMATHHILPEDLVGCPPTSSFALPDGLEYLIGHNIDYDWKVLGSAPVKRICVLAMCRKLWPEIDSHKQSAMLYFLHGAKARERLKDAHSALCDVENCFVVLKACIEKAGGFGCWEDLWVFSEACRIPEVITFGKHKGSRIADLPRDYVGWLLRQTDVDPYLRVALEGRP